jgi:2-oxoisovalerate dehydrogenase E2 component (dihydrolipoyl transacylase)
MSTYLLPDVGEGLTEAEIVSWKVKVGDVVAINDIVVEIETAKSLVELPSPYAGTVTGLLVPEGETVAVGTPIIAIGEEAAASAAEVIDTNVPPEGNPTLVGYGPREVVAMRRARKGAGSSGTDATGPTHMQVQGAFAQGGAPAPAVPEYDEPAVPAVPATTAPAAPAADVRALAKPPVRKLAKDLGVDLATVRASGPGGVVTRADVEAAAAEPAGAAAPRRPAVASGEREWREPVKGVRRMMAQAMVASAFSAPHVTEWVTVDVTRTMELVERLKARREFSDVRVSPLLVLARAAILAMRRTPEINSFWDEPAQEVVYKGFVNLGIAAATPRGLVVPNVKDAQDLSLHDLAVALGQLTATAREGRTQPAEMSGGTFTITNVGVFGVDSGTPIINPGESAILCFGAVKKQPWVVTRDGVDEIVPRQVTTLALSFDHRHIDGEKGSRFLADVAGILEDPASALLF